MAFLRVGGQPIKGSSLPTHTWNANLVEFEGPLISLYRSERGEDVLYVWLDCNASKNRWGIVPLSRDTLREYLERDITLRSVFERAETITLFDIGEDLKRSRFQEVDWAVFPEQYRPKTDSYLLDIIATDAARSLATDKTDEFYLGIDGEDLYVEDLSAIQKTFLQLYSFQYGLEYLDRDAVWDRVGGYAGEWSGGLSSVWMFSGLNSVIPSIHRPRISELRYNSPGHIKLDLLPNLALEIQGSVDLLMNQETFAIFETFYQTVYSYLKKSGISGFDSEIRNITKLLTPEVNGSLSNYVSTFLEMIGWSARRESLAALDESPLAQLRLLFAYYRRLKKLRVFVDQGRLSIGASKIVS